MTLKFRKNKTSVLTAVCPTCNNNMERETNADARTLYTWKCRKCGKKV